MTKVRFSNDEKEKLYDICQDENFIAHSELIASLMNSDFSKYEHMTEPYKINNQIQQLEKNWLHL